MLANTSLTVGGATQANATLRSANGTELSGRTVSWSSSAPNVATVSTTGLVSGAGVGTATITASSEGRSGSAAITIDPPPVTSITFPAESIAVPLRATFQLTPTLRDASGDIVTGRAITYTTSAETIVSVSSSGLVRSLLPGVSTIHATVDGKSASVKVSGSLADLTRIIDSVRQAHGLPAMGGAIVHREGLIGIGVAGNRRITGGLPVTVNDKWHLGSNTKPMTAMLAGMAVEAGVLTWQRTVEQALPDLASTMRAEYKPVPLTELLSHTGGTINSLQGLTGGTNLPAQRLAWANSTLQQAPYGPRGRHYYSNPAFGIAGLIVERAWSSTYEQLMTARLFQPLGITDAGWGPTTGPGGNDQPQGHKMANGAWTVCEGCDNVPGVSSAGTAHMSLGSWGRIIRELLLADQGRSAMLTQNTARFLTTNAVPANGTGRYGMGWVIPNTATRQATHDGSNTNNFSRAWLYLDVGVAYLITINADPEGGTTRSAMNGMQTRLDRYWTDGR